MLEKNKDISLDELAEKDKLSVRAYNLCENEKLTSLDKIIEYYYQYGTFTRIRNCGAKTNKELLSICKKYLGNNQHHSKISEELRIYNQFSELKKSLFDRYFKFMASKLSVRAYNGIKTISNPISVIPILSRMFDPYFRFDNLRNIGDKYIVELSNFKKDITELINNVYVLEGDNLIRMKVKIVIYENFGELPAGVDKDLRDLFDTRGKLKLFKLMDALLRSKLLVKDNRLPIFLFLFSHQSPYKDFSSLASNLPITRARVLQIKIELLRNSSSYLGFISHLDKDLFCEYNLPIDHRYFSVDTTFSQRVNKHEGVSFNPLFYALFYQFIYGDKFQILLDAGVKDKRKYAIFKDYSGRHYLLSKTLEESFDFASLMQDIQRRTSSKVKESYSFYLTDYLRDFCKYKDMTISFAILDVSCAIIIRYKGVYISRDRQIIFKRNTRRKIYEYAYEILEETGKEMHVDDILNSIRNIYPSFKSNRLSISAALNNEKELFFSIGKSRKYALRKWEKERYDLKSGSIRDIVEGYLEKESLPKHSSEILSYVSKFRQTTEISLEANLKLDGKKRFVFFPGHYIGLRRKDYPQDKL